MDEFIILESNQPNLTAQDFSSWASRLMWIVDRFEAGTRSAFAARIGVSAQAVTGLLANSTPSGDTLGQIARAYPLVNPHWLLTGDGAPLRSGLEPLSNAQRAALRDDLQRILRSAENALDVVEQGENDKPTEGNFRGAMGE